METHSDQSIAIGIPTKHQLRNALIMSCLQEIFESIKDSKSFVMKCLLFILIIVALIFLSF